MMAGRRGLRDASYLERRVSGVPGGTAGQGWVYWSLVRSLDCYTPSHSCLFLPSQTGKLPSMPQFSHLTLSIIFIFLIFFFLLSFVVNHIVYVALSYIITIKMIVFSSSCPAFSLSSFLHPLSVLSSQRSNISFSYYSSLSFYSLVNHSLSLPPAHPRLHSILLAILFLPPSSPSLASFFLRLALATLAN